MSITLVAKGLRRWAAICGLVFAGSIMVGCRTQQAPEHQFAEVPPGLAPAPASTTSPAPAAADLAAPKSASAPAPATAPLANPAGAPALAKNDGSESEMLHVGDTLTVTLTDTPIVMPPAEEKVKPDGTITLTLNQVFKADGKTRGDLEKEIRARYVPDYFRQMTVTVKQQESTRWYYVDGEVRSPSRQIYNIRITVSKAIATAGGFTDFANKKKVRLTRAGWPDADRQLPQGLGESSP